MKTTWKAGCILLALAGSQYALAAADDMQPSDETIAQEQEKARQAAPVAVTPTGEQVVTVNSGNETVDKAANYAVKCTERAAAMKACDSMGAFKAIACRKLAEIKYKGVECPLQ